MNVTTLPKKPCAQGGCSVLIPGADRFCEAHKIGRYSRKDDPIKRLYNVAKWHWVRHNVLSRDRLCRDCASWVAEDVHHVVPARVWVARHGGNLQSFYDESNLIALCHACHSRRTAEEGRW
jgi:5-methylcytosine-specific restriction protein A